MPDTLTRQEKNDLKREARYEARSVARRACTRPSNSDQPGDVRDLATQISSRGRDSVTDQQRNMVAQHLRDVQRWDYAFAVRDGEKVYLLKPYERA